MTMENIKNAVKAYNDNRDKATATESAKAYASIEESCKEISKRNRKASLDSLVASENRSEVLTAFIMGYTYNRVSVKTDKDTGNASIAETPTELDWKHASKAYADKHDGASLADSVGFNALTDGFFDHLCKGHVRLQGRGGKSAVLVSKTKDGVVRDTIAPDFEANDGISATKAMKMLTELYAALLPEDIRVKPCKCDLNRLHDAVITPKGAKQLKSSKDTLYKQFFMGVRVRTTGNAYEVYAK